MTVTVDDGQSVVMKTRMPELERLQQQKERSEREAGEAREDRIQG